MSSALTLNWQIIWAPKKLASLSLLFRLNCHSQSAIYLGGFTLTCRLRKTTYSQIVVDQFGYICGVEILKAYLAFFFVSIASLSSQKPFRKISFLVLKHSDWQLSAVSSVQEVSKNKLSGSSYHGRGWQRIVIRMITTRISHAASRN